MLLQENHLEITEVTLPVLSEERGPYLNMAYISALCQAQSCGRDWDSGSLMLLSPESV